MPCVRFARRRSFHTPLWRLLAVLVGVGQLLAVSAAWLDRAPDAMGAQTHAESGGTRLHHGHSASDCELCTAQHLGGVPAVTRSLRDAAPPSLALPRSQGPAVVQAERVAANRSRAPPIDV